MKLPNSDKVHVAEEKVVAYLLNPIHPDGAPKAKFFSAVGFQVDQWNELADALRQLARDYSVTETVVTPHGEKYIVEGVLETPLGASPMVRTVWIIDSGRQTPRLVTAYPLGKGT
jgi:hypothetical protein